jgi:dienelactone hydrolase
MDGDLPASRDERFRRLPSALAKQTRFETLAGEVPALLAHPDWTEPAPLVLWMHGRTVRKELDPGRYLRWIRAGIGACAMDLPGHGERAVEGMDAPGKTLYVVEQMIGEIDRVIDDLRSRFGEVFDTERMAIGGMSAGGMATLRRLCDAHPFRCAAVESTAGDFSQMAYTERYPRDIVDRLDPVRHLVGWRPIPLLALHSETDQWVPVRAIRNLVERLRERYSDEGADPAQIELITWPETGAPYEHAGFGRVANDAKNAQVAFFERWLLGAE